jgi:[acyl-carrier-protein] S-malonyltransferase
MWEGPESELLLTENAQPAIMAASIAVVRVLAREGRFDLAAQARLVAGHSLGEYTALCAAGGLSLADTARLLRIRGQAMQTAVPLGEGAMAALLGADIELAETAAAEASAEGGICVVANDNAPGQVVISGSKAAVERAGEIAKARGAKRAIALNVSAPFHCPLMQPAADVMAEALSKVTIRPLAVPLLANVTAGETAEPQTIRRLLVEQVTGRVRWRESMLALRELGVEVAVEAGGNKVLTGMLKRTDKDLQTVTLDLPAEIETFSKSL